MSHPTDDTGVLVLVVRCATDHRHRVGDVHRLADGTLLWRSRLPQSSSAWDPVEWPVAEPPASDGSHWTEEGWHTTARLGPSDRQGHVWWGCRCTSQPAGWMAEDLVDAALDRTRREALLWP